MINSSYYKMKLLTCHFVQGTAFPLSMFYHPCSENVEHLKKKKTLSEIVSGIQSNLVNADAIGKRDGATVRIMTLRAV